MQSFDVTEIGDADATAVAAHDVVIDLMSLAEQLGDELTAQLRKQGVRDLKPTWAITLYRMGDQIWRGVELSQIWLGVGNISYPLKKMVALGFLFVDRDPRDGRSIAVHRTEDGKKVADIVESVLQRQGRMVLSNLALKSAAPVTASIANPMMVHLTAASRRKCAK